MCGILVTHGLTRPFSHRLLGSLRRRGPDQIGFWSNGATNIAHARLAIIGLDERGAEPLENDTHVLAFNGEIYNFLQIRRRLENEGIRVAGTTDGEVLLHAWSRWGTEILPSLEGFWAFAAYDKRANTLTLVRDQLGIKPLYYWLSRGRLCVSSMIRTILDVTEETVELDYAAMSEYVRYQFTFGDKTFVKHLRKVLPGQLVEIDLAKGEASARTYEDLFAPREGLEEVTDAWVEETRDVLIQCALDSTISDTSFTTFCSGGIDSSLITRIVRPELAYHCNYSDPDCNETFFAQEAVRDTPTRLFVVNATESLNLVQRCADIVEDFDEPTIGSVILPLDDLLGQVKRRFKVILTGTGGDELFAGYVRYQLALGRCYQDSYRALHARMQSLEQVSERFELAHRKGDTSLYRFYDPGVETTFRDAFAACKRGTDDLGAMLAFDRRYFLQGLLNIDDKMCGRHSLEGRPSLLHQRLVRRVCSAQHGVFLNGGQLKPVLRRVANDLLPKSIHRRSDKMGFTTPVGTFVNQSSHHIREQLTTSRYRDLYDLRRMSLTAETKYSREVFGLLMLDLWLNRYAKAGAGASRQYAA
jgi:asparagine synthase (glutamine-hydrolysing)